MAAGVTASRWLKPRDEQAALDAEDLIVFANAAEEAGYPELAWRSRAVARSLLETIQTLGQERAVREALQERCERLQAIIGKAAYQQTLNESDKAWLDAYDGFDG